MKKNIILFIILVILFIIVAVQAVQLNVIKEKIDNNDLGGTCPLDDQKVNVPSNIKNLPGMVGGC